MRVAGHAETSLNRHWCCSMGKRREEEKRLATWRRVAAWAGLMAEEKALLRRIGRCCLPRFPSLCPRTLLILPEVIDAWHMGVGMGRKATSWNGESGPGGYRKGGEEEGWESAKFRPVRTARTTADQSVQARHPLAVAGATAMRCSAPWRFAGCSGDSLRGEWGSDASCWRMPFSLCDHALKINACRRF